MQKWFFDTDVGICREFVYGGCGGNGNRFATSEECTSLCVQRVELPVEGGSQPAQPPPTGTTRLHAPLIETCSIVHITRYGSTPKLVLYPFKTPSFPSSFVLF